MTMTIENNKIRKVFKGDKSFEALQKAQDWCKEQGISFGSLQRDDPVGLLWGDYEISKWRNLSQHEISILHGTMTGSKRNGPVIIEICKRPESQRKG